MKVQLDDKSKAEFIEHIAKDSITCWFDGDEFVMPSGQGRTARGIVLGKLLVWQHRQTEVDELQYKAKLRESDHQALLVKYQATKKCWEDMSKEKEELQKQRDSFIKAYEIEMEKSIELQKRVDATLKVVQSMRNEVKHGHMSDEEVQMLSSFAEELEQALKGGEDASN